MFTHRVKTRDLVVSDGGKVVPVGGQSRPPKSVVGSTERSVPETDKGFPHKKTSNEDLRSERRLEQTPTGSFYVTGRNLRVRVHT